MPITRPGAIICLLLLAASPGAISCTTAGQSAGAVQPSSAAADERTIRDIIDHQARAWNAGDARAHARDLDEEVVFTNILGQSFSGAEAFIRQHEVIFQGLFRGTTVHGDITVLRFPTPDVALVEILTAATGLSRMPPGAVADEQGRLRTRLLQVLVRRAGEWRIVAYHNVAVNPTVAEPSPGTRQ